MTQDAAVTRAQQQGSDQAHDGEESYSSFSDGTATDADIDTDRDRDTDIDVDSSAAHRQC